MMCTINKQARNLSFCKMTYGERFDNDSFDDDSLDNDSFDDDSSDDDSFDDDIFDDQEFDNQEFDRGTDEEKARSSNEGSGFKVPAN